MIEVEDRTNKLLLLLFAQDLIEPLAISKSSLWAVSQFLQIRQNRYTNLMGWQSPSYMRHPSVYRPHHLLTEGVRVDDLKQDQVKILEPVRPGLWAAA